MQVNKVGGFSMVDLLVVLLRVVERVQGVGVGVDGRVAVLELVVKGLVVQGGVLVVGGEIGGREVSAGGGVSEWRRGGIGDGGVGHRLQASQLHQTVTV